MITWPSDRAELFSPLPPTPLPQHQPPPCSASNPTSPQSTPPPHRKSSSSPLVLICTSPSTPRPTCPKQQRLLHRPRRFSTSRRHRTGIVYRMPHRDFIRQQKTQARRPLCPTVAVLLRGRALASFCNQMALIPSSHSLTETLWRCKTTVIYWLMCLPPPLPCPTLLVSTSFLLRPKFLLEQFLSNVLFITLTINFVEVTPIFVVLLRYKK